MIKLSSKIDILRAKTLIRQMPLSDKIKLMRELQKETWAKEWSNLLKNIDQRRRKHKISAKEISKEITKAREEFHARRH